MARAYASAIIKAPVETVWSLIRNFNGLPDWVPIIAAVFLIRMIGKNLD